MTYKREPRWHSELLYSPNRLPRTVAPVVLTRGSLTAYLHGLCKREFRVDVLQQRWDLPLCTEAQSLGLHMGARANIREVLLYVDGEALIFGRTVVPKQSSDRIGRPLQRLGRTPLGAMLFKSPHLKRTPFQWASVESGDRIHQRIAPHVAALRKSLWARRSIFIYQGVPLMLTEVFLKIKQPDQNIPFLEPSLAQAYQPHAHVDTAIRGAHARRRFT